MEAIGGSFWPLGPLGAGEGAPRRQKNLRTIFADNEVVKWTKTVILKRNPTGPDPAGR